MPEFFTVRTMVPADYPEVIELWKNGEGIGLSNADSEENIARFLERNPDLSFVAVDNGKIIGTILCGHDGRRGYIYHVMVSEVYRNQGIGKALVNESLKGLQKQGIDKCHLFVFDQNELGKRFWLHTGWTLREDIVVMSKNC